MARGIEHGVAALFRMDEATWARHASPWSVWTRVASLPLLLAALWSHAWIGWAGALAAMALVVLWLWLNPRLFPPPASTEGWAARATFGERVWLDRARIPIPPHHARMAAILGVAAGLGFIIAVLGALANDLAATLAGGLIAWFAKMWFCDRMVWLYEDMKDVDPAYRSWLR